MADKNTGVKYSGSFEEVIDVADGRELDDHPSANLRGEFNGTQENRHNTSSDVLMCDNERTVARVPVARM